MQPASIDGPTTMTPTKKNSYREEGHGEVLEDGEDAEGRPGAAGGLGVVHGQGDGGPDDGGDDANICGGVGCV